ncbi:MAG: tetratricopeptide repeat protein [Verrucomicrobiales bacterium]|nr:tetratricopeptide repeat protein [Verrucomicrobiales bacterium]
MSELSHGILLQEQGRLEEAEACYRSVLLSEPDNDFVHNRLALCLLSQQGKKNLALDSINEAIRIEPDDAFHHGVKALILSDLRKGKEAVDAADRAIALNPEDSFALAAKAHAYCSLERWAEGEVWSRKALEADADNSMAANLLSHTLRLQGKSHENEAAVEQLLADDPEDSYAHINAGWSALHRGDHKTAETHFREALRLDPESEMAREGLLESFRARSRFYRAYLSYSFFMQRFTGGKQWMIIIGLYLAFQFVRRATEQVSPVIAVVLGLAWLALVMWVWLAPGIGNFLILLDRTARLALDSGEKWQGLVVGGGLLLGIFATGFGIGFDLVPLTYGGIGLLASTVPASLAFGNDSLPGRIVFGSIAGYVYLATLVIVVLESERTGGETSPPLVVTLALIGLIAAVGCTWLGNIRSLRMEKED